MSHFGWKKPRTEHKDNQNSFQRRLQKTGCLLSRSWNDKNLDILKLNKDYFKEFDNQLADESFVAPLVIGLLTIAARLQYESYFSGG